MVSSCRNGEFSAGELTDTEHEGYVANATLGSRDVINRLKVDWKIIEQKEE